MTVFPSACACGSTVLAAIKPGEDGETMILRGEEVVMRDGIPDQAWCLPCWLARFGRRDGAIPA